MGTGHVPQLYKDFATAAEWLGRRHGLSTVFNDLLTVTVCAHHEVNIMTRCKEKDEANEAIYFETIDKYDKAELGELTKMMAYVVANARQAPYSDLLGQYFTEHITRGHNGQFFTPEAICKLMTGMHGKPGTITGKSVADPACGSGRMLLAFAESNPNNTFFAADNAGACAKMSAINFCLNGLQGEVAWMNTLSMEWYGGWQINRYPFLGIRPIDKDQSRIWSNPQIQEAAEDRHANLKNHARGRGDGQQLTMF